MLPRDRRSADARALGIRPIGVGALVRVQSVGGELWSANVTSVSDRLIGLRGWTSVDDTFRERDTVTLLVGHDDRLISAHARVLAATGSLMRIVRRDDSDDADRRRDPRLRVDLTATLTVPTEGGAIERVQADVVDLSTSGCAVRSDASVLVGTNVGVAVDLHDTSVELTGIVMRTWNGAGPRFAHAGIKFDPLATSVSTLLSRFLVNQLQSEPPARR